MAVFSAVVMALVAALIAVATIGAGVLLIMREFKRPVGKKDIKMHRSDDEPTHVSRRNESVRTRRRVPQSEVSPDAPTEVLSTGPDKE